MAYVEASGTGHSHKAEGSKRMVVGRKKDATRPVTVCHVMITMCDLSAASRSRVRRVVSPAGRACMRVLIAGGVELHYTKRKTVTYIMRKSRECGSRRSKLLESSRARVGVLVN